MNDQIYNKRWRILAVVLLSPLMGNIDSSIVNVALPSMANHLNAEINSIQWVVTSYLMIISAFVLIFGKLGDKLGKALIFNYGFLLFGFGSFLCALSKSLVFLVFSRIVQALGAAMFMSTNQGIVATVFSANERGRALGLLGSAVAIGTMLGPPLGGIIVQLFNWQSAFLINIPISIFAFAAGNYILPKKENSQKVLNFDFKGAFLFVVFIVSLFWALLSGERLGWSNNRIVISLIISFMCGISFYFLEKSQGDPIVDLSMFNNKLFNISVFCGFISFVAIFSVNIIQPFYLQGVIKMSPAASGVIMLAFPISTVIVSPVSGYVADKIGAKILTVLGLFTMSVGLINMALLNDSSSYAHIMISFATLGIGSGMFQSPNNSIIMALAPKDKLGVIGSINALVRNIGMVSGIAFSVALLYNRMSSRVGYRVTGYLQGRPDIFLYGMRIVYLSAASMCVLGMVLTIIRIVKKEESDALVK